MAHLLDKDNQLYHVKDTRSELVITSLKGQYKNETELLTLLNFISTLEKMELM